MLFREDHRDKGDRARRIYAMYELAYTGVDFAAALCFLVGSVMFLYPSLMPPATWLFIVGSLLFAAKPSLRLAREVKLVVMGRTGQLAERAGE